MTPKELKILFVQKDVTQAQIVADVGKTGRPVTPMAVSQVVRGKSRSRRIEKIIAQRVNLPRQIIFPINPDQISHDEAAA